MPLSSEQETKLEGGHKFWYGSGGLWKHGFYQDGKLEGKFRVWYFDGDPWIQAFYRNGKLQGEYRWYGASLLAHQYFREGKSIDSSFSLKKKLTLLRMKRILQNRIISSIDMMLISDLARIVCE